MAFLSTSVEEVLRRLRSGEPVALPTETVYGLAADACSESAVQQVFALKGRPSHNPLIVHVADAAMAKRYVEWNDLAEQLAKQHWPGALTLVLPQKPKSGIAPAVSAGGETLAIRMPSHPLMQEVLRAFDGGLAAPSANRSGRISPTQAAHVLEEFLQDDLMVLEGGACEVGLESTVIDCSGNSPVVLRPGSVLMDTQSDNKPVAAVLKSPGQLASHYAPQLPVRLNADHVAADEALLAFGEPLEGAAEMLNLSMTSNIEEAASHLFAMLRALDKPENFRAIAVMPIPQEGIGVAINDRLKRAAAARDT